MLPTHTMALLESQIQALGWQAPDFDLLGVDGTSYTLKDFMFSRGLLIVFTCNHCPYAKASWSPLVELHYTYPDIAILAINSNDAKQYPEDNYPHMIALSKKYGIPFPYVHDVSQGVAKAYDAQCTPDNYLFKNEQGKFRLFYQGRINNNRQDASLVTKKDLELHIQELLENKSSSEPWHPSSGCSIKWKSA